VWENSLHYPLIVFIHLAIEPLPSLQESAADVKGQEIISSEVMAFMKRGTRIKEEDVSCRGFCSAALLYELLLMFPCAALHAGDSH
jgi:hypothetical protein